MTGFILSRLLLLALVLSTGTIYAQPDNADEHPCEQLEKGKRSQPIRKAYKMPKFPGGEAQMQEFIKGSFRHSKTKPKEGIVYIAVIINNNGTISGERVLKGINGEYNREALRVIRSMPKWEPGECEEGKKVAVEVLIKVKV